MRFQPAGRCFSQLYTQLAAEYHRRYGVQLQIRRLVGKGGASLGDDSLVLSTLSPDKEVGVVVAAFIKPSLTERFRIVWDNFLAGLVMQIFDIDSVFETLRDLFFSVVSMFSFRGFFLGSQIV